MTRSSLVRCIYLTSALFLTISTLHLLYSSSPSSLSRKLRQDQQCTDNLGLCSNDEDCCQSLFCDKSLSVMGYRCRSDPDSQKKVENNSQVERKDEKVLSDLSITSKTPSQLRPVSTSCVSSFSSCRTDEECCGTMKCFTKFTNLGLQCHEPIPNSELNRYAVQLPDATVDLNPASFIEEQHVTDYKPKETLEKRSVPSSTMFVEKPRLELDDVLKGNVEVNYAPPSKILWREPQRYPENSSVSVDNKEAMKYASSPAVSWGESRTKNENESTMLEKKTGTKSVPSLVLATGESQMRSKDNPIVLGNKADVSGQMEGKSESSCQVWRGKCSSNSDCCEDLKCGQFNGVDKGEPRCYFEITGISLNVESPEKDIVEQVEISKSPEHTVGIVEPKDSFEISEPNKPVQVISQDENIQKVNNKVNENEQPPSQDLMMDWFEYSVNQINRNFNAYKKMVEEQRKAQSTKSNEVPTKVIDHSIGNSV